MPSRAPRLLREQLARELLLLRREAVRELDGVRDVEVPLLHGAHHGHPLPRNLARLPRLGDARVRQPHGVPVQVRHRRLEPHQRVQQADARRVPQVVAVPREPAVHLHLAHHNLEVSRVAVKDGLALLEEAHLVPVPHPRLHLYRDGVHLAHELDVGAVLAHVLRVLLVHPWPDLPGHHLLLAVALPRALRGLDHVLVARHLQRAPHVQVLERRLHEDADVVAAGGLRLLLLAPEAEPERAAAAAEELREYVARAAAASALLLLLLESLLAVAVVHLALLGVGQHLEGVVNLRELLLSLGIPGVLVGVVLQGQLAVRPLDRAVIGAAGHAKHAVEVRARKRHERREQDEQEPGGGRPAGRHVRTRRRGSHPRLLHTRRSCRRGGAGVARPAG
mmetsp:Transcript_8227/g.28867  ORF Transcript_8227/g.28867 Transcript_8227/m.28867 type:complete len:392 (+) Transcript_8227:216-1391(+)